MLVKDKANGQDRITRMFGEPMGYIDGPNTYQFELSDPITGLDPTGTTDLERTLWTNMRDYLKSVNPNDTRIQQLDDLIKYNGWQEYDWNSNGGKTCPQQQYNWKQEQALRDKLQATGLNVNIATGFHVLERKQYGNDKTTELMNDTGIGHVDIYYNGVLIRVGAGGASPKGIDVTTPGKQEYWDANYFTDYQLSKLEGPNYTLEAGSGKGKKVDDATDAEIEDAIKAYPTSGGGGMTDNCRNDIMDAEYGGGLTGFSPFIRGSGTHPSNNLKKALGPPPNG
jgi:hypothetical protein